MPLIKTVSLDSAPAAPVSNSLEMEDKPKCLLHNFAVFPRTCSGQEEYRQIAGFYSTTIKIIAGTL